MSTTTARPGMTASDAWEIDPHHPGPTETIAEVWRYRRLMRFLATRALQKIYRKTVLGWLWLVIIPLFPILLRTAVFGSLLGVPSNGVPYILFIAAGTLIWDLFAQALMWGTRSLEISGSVAEQTYLPRAIIPIGGMAPAALDFVFKLGAFLIIVAVFWISDGRPPISLAAFGWTIGALTTAWMLALGISLFTSLWGEAGRDTRLILGQVLAVWYLMTPVLYPLSEMPERWRAWAAVNPMAPLVETFRWSLFGVGVHDPRAFAMSVALMAIILVTGLTYFARRDAAINEQR